MILPLVSHKNINFVPSIISRASSLIKNKMKKLLALFVLVAVAVAAQAQSLTGVNWFSDMSDGDADGGLMMLFEPEGACAVTLLMVQGDENLTISFTYMVPGVYSIDGKELSVILLTDCAEINADIDTDGLTDEQKEMVKLLQPVLDAQKEQLKAGLAENFDWDDERFTITELTDTRLVLTDSDGKEMVFTPVEE